MRAYKPSKMDASGKPEVLERIPNGLKISDGTSEGENELDVQSGIAGSMTQESEREAEDTKLPARLKMSDGTLEEKKKLDAESTAVSAPPANPEVSKIESGAIAGSVTQESEREAADTKLPAHSKLHDKFALKFSNRQDKPSSNGTGNGKKRFLSKSFKGIRSKLHAVFLDKSEDSKIADGTSEGEKKLDVNWNPETSESEAGAIAGSITQESEREAENTKLPARLLPTSSKVLHSKTHEEFVDKPEGLKTSEGTSEGEKKLDVQSGIAGSMTQESEREAEDTKLPAHGDH